MNSKVTTNSQLSRTESKHTHTHTEQIKQTTRTGTQSKIWRSHGVLSAGRRKVEKGGKGTGIKMHNW